MSKRRLAFVTFIIAICFCIGGCGKKEEPIEAVQEAGNTVETEASEEVLTPEQEEYLELVAEIDVLQQKKTMILSFYNNPELVMPIEQGSEPMSAEERLTRELEENDEKTEDDAYTIKNMHSFWTIYDNLKGSSNPDEIPNDNLDQAIQELKTQKADLETEVEAMEEELKSLTSML